MIPIVDHVSKTGGSLFVGASLYDSGTYRISDQRSLRRFCAYAQNRQRLHRSYTQNIEVDEVLNLILDTSPH